MMAIGVLLPLISVFLIIYLVVRAGSGSKKLFQGRYMKRVIVGYLIILLASPIVLYFLEGKEQKVVERRSGEEVVEIHDRFYDSLYDEGKIYIEALELRDEFELNTASSSLTITHIDEGSYKTIIIEKNKSLDKKIIGRTYVLPSVIDDFEFTQAIPALEVELSGDKLKVGNPSELTELYMRLFEKEFTINQFSDDADMYFGSSHHMSAISDPFLYLQIPEDMTIVSESDSIELVYVEE